MYAAVDIGSNTILLLVADKRRNRLRTVAEEQRVPRLGRNMDQQGRLTSQAINQTVKIIRDFIFTVEKVAPPHTPIVLTGTSAVREAANHQELVKRIYEQTGLTLKVINGDTEARLTYMGALSTISLQSPQDKLVIDIGGGSTELIYGNQNEIHQLHSFPMGSVRYSERFFDDGVASMESLSECRAAIYDQFKKVPFTFHSKEFSLVGVEGTVTSIAHLMRDKTDYDPSAINGAVFTADELRHAVRWVAARTPQELRDAYPSIMKGRADVFLGGILILECLLHTYNINTMISSVGGIRHGAILSYLA